MTIKFLILSPRHTPDSNAIWKAALANDWKIERLYKYRVPEHITSNEAKIYGENLFAEIVAQQLDIALIGTPPSWLAELPFHFLQREVTFKQLKDCRNFTTPRFIKPASGKLFDAKVYQSAEDLPSNDSQDDETPVLISKPVEWITEFRCFIADRTLQTLSIYNRNGELDFETTNDELQAANSYCQSILDDHSIHLPPSIVIDIGQIKDRGWAIVEANPTFASGIYEADTSKVLYSIEKSCIPKSSVTQELNHWVLNS